jgi:hypothetical protein
MMIRRVSSLRISDFGVCFDSHVIVSLPSLLFLLNRWLSCIKNFVTYLLFISCINVTDEWLE